MGLMLILFFPLFKNSTYSFIPPWYLNFNSFASEDLLSLKIMFTPVFKKASSLSLFSIILKLKSIFLNVLVDGRKVIDVPVK